jgi:hypothetical protein
MRFFAALKEGKQATRIKITTRTRTTNMDLKCS